MTATSSPKRGLLVVISGPSGAGKTTIARSMERRFDDAVLSVSATTRPQATKDRDGVDYHFLTEEEFLRREAAEEFLETAVYAGNRYGTLRAPVEKALAEGRLVILEIDVQGAIQIKDRMPDAFGVFILPPSEQALLDRLRARKREAEEIIQKRFAVAQREIETARSSDVYDAFVTNDLLERAIEETAERIEAARDTR
jgi:guanylate kinase